MWPALISAGVQFLTTPSGPSAAQVAAQQAADAEAQKRAWIIGGALAGGALLVYLFASRR